MRPAAPPIELDDTDRLLINSLQGGFPLVSRPFQAVADRLGLLQSEVILRIERLVGAGALSRFAPMFDAEKIGGAVSLAAMIVPEARFEEVAAVLDEMPAIAHNYERNHRLNMWFVIATETRAGIGRAQREIEARTGLNVMLFPKVREYFVGMRVDV